MDKIAFEKFAFFYNLGYQIVKEASIAGDAKTFEKILQTVWKKGIVKPFRERIRLLRGENLSPEALGKLEFDKSIVAGQGRVVTNWLKTLREYQAGNIKDPHQLREMMKDIRDDKMKEVLPFIDRWRLNRLVKKYRNDAL